MSFPVTVENVRRPQVIGIPAHRAGGAGAWTPPSRTSCDEIRPPFPTSSRFRSGTWRRSTAVAGLPRLRRHAVERPAPLVVEGFRRPGEELMDAYQYSPRRDGLVVGRAPVGDMRYHPHPAHPGTSSSSRSSPCTMPPTSRSCAAESRPTAWLPPTPSTSRSSARAGTGSRPLDRLRRRGALWVRRCSRPAGATRTSSSCRASRSTSPAFPTAGTAGSRQPAWEPLRDRHVEQRRVASAPPRRPARRSAGPRRALARDRRVTVSGRGGCAAAWPRPREISQRLTGNVTTHATASASARLHQKERP